MNVSSNILVNKFHDFCRKHGYHGRILLYPSMQWIELQIMYKGVGAGINVLIDDLNMDNDKDLETMIDYLLIKMQEEILARFK